MQQIILSKVVEEMSFEIFLFHPLLMEDGLENSLMTSHGRNIVRVIESFGKTFWEFLEIYELHFYPSLQQLMEDRSKVLK